MPMSSRSGKKTSNDETWLSGAWTTAKSLSERGSLPSRMTSPVAGLTMSAAAQAPSRSASEISTSSMPSLRSCSMTAAVTRLPA